MDTSEDQLIRSRPRASLFFAGPRGPEHWDDGIRGNGLWLPIIATDLHVSIPVAGYIIAAYALGVVVGAPLLTAPGGQNEPSEDLSSG